MRDYCHRAIQSYDGCTNWYDLSYENEYEACEGNDEIPFKKGHKYEDLLQIFKNDIPYKNTHLETKVSKIDFTDAATVKVFDQDGTVFSADIVIFTGSLGILKGFQFQMFSSSAMQPLNFSSILMKNPRILYLFWLWRNLKGNVAGNSI